MKMSIILGVLHVRRGLLFCSLSYSALAIVTDDLRSLSYRTESSSLWSQALHYCRMAAADSLYGIAFRSVAIFVIMHAQWLTSRPLRRIFDDHHHLQVDSQLGQF